MIEDTRERIHTKNKEVGGERVALPKAPTTLKVATGRAVDIDREGGRGDTDFWKFQIYIEEEREQQQGLSHPILGQAPRKDRTRSRATKQKNKLTWRRGRP